jgi:hypothetical protein
VPGGIRYDDPTVKLDRNQTTYSADRLILISRGSLSAVGDSGILKRRVRDASGVIIDYEQKLLTTNAQYKTFYAGKYSADDLAFRVPYADWGGNLIATATYGVYIGNWLDSCHNKVTAEGLFITHSDLRKYENGWSYLRWDAFPSWPSNVGAGDDALFPVRFRTANLYAGFGLALKGSMASLGKPLESASFVPTRFDYSLQLMKPQDIRDMGLPLTMVPCSWQRL